MLRMAFPRLLSLSRILQGSGLWKLQEVPLLLFFGREYPLNFGTFSGVGRWRPNFIRNNGGFVADVKFWRLALPDGGGSKHSRVADTCRPARHAINNAAGKIGSELDELTGTRSLV